MVRELKRVVITGVGIISPYGIGAPLFWEGIKSGRCAIRKIQLFDPTSVGSQVAGEVPNFKIEDHVPTRETKRLARVAVMAIKAAKEAFENARLDVSAFTEEERQQTAVILGTGAGGIEYGEAQYSHFYQGRKKQFHPFAVSSSFVGMLSSEVSIALGLKGLSHVLSTGCTSSTDALGYAFEQIRIGRARRILTGGVDACITPGIMTSYSLMKIVSTHYNETPEKASRPFDKNRDGFVIGEGAWLFVLEELDSARDRGAPLFAEVLGYGSTCDAFHRVQIMPDGIESARAITEALKDAQVEPKQVDYVNLHGTSTPLNDKTETSALKLAFNSHSHHIPMSATKSYVGHPQGASGACGVAATLLTFQESVIHPTLNYEEPDPECDLDYVPNEPRKKEVSIAVVNCIAFGSKNSALVLKRVEG